MTFVVSSVFCNHGYFFSGCFSAEFKVNAMGTKAGVKHCNSHDPNGMQMRKTRSPSLAFDSAYVKYGVRPGSKSSLETFDSKTVLKVFSQRLSY